MFGRFTSETAVNGRFASETAVAKLDPVKKIRWNF
jgi:hypothetical protein